MAVSRKNAPHKRSEPARSAPAPAQGGDGGAQLRDVMSPQTSAAQTPPTTSGGDESLFPNANFRQALEQEVAQAIQPVLDEFRQQMAKGLVPEKLSNGMDGNAQRDGSQAHSEEMPRGSHANGGTARQSHPQPTRVTPPADAVEAGASDGAEKQAEVPVKNIAHGAHHLPSGPVAGAVQAVEHLGGQWLQSMLVAGLGALLAESTHAGAQQHAEQGLHTLLQKLFETVPSGIINQKMQGKTERTLQLILRDALDAVFAEPVRAAMQHNGQQTIEKPLHGDFGGTLKMIQETLQIMATALLAVLRRHQQTILRLLLAIALLALESSLVEPKQAK